MAISGCTAAAKSQLPTLNFQLLEAIIPIDKPVGWTSFQVVNKLKWHIRHLTGIKKFKIGHAGTLDPLASGLLLVCVGKATKQIEQLQSGIKEYSGTMVLGATTPCFDLERAIDAYYPYNHITDEAIEQARHQFIGEIEQVPPIFSAVKVDGQRAYLAARDDNKEVSISAKKITIYEFEISRSSRSYRDSRLSSQSRLSSESRASSPSSHLYLNPQGSVPEGLPLIDFHVTCSKGTYIRSLARDMGEALGSGAFLSALRRERIGDYTIDNAIKLEEIEQVITIDNPEFKMLIEAI